MSSQTATTGLWPFRGLWQQLVNIFYRKTAFGAHEAEALLPYPNPNPNPGVPHSTLTMSISTSSSSYQLSSGMLTPCTPGMLDPEHHNTPLPSGLEQQPTPQLDIAQLDRELECLTQLSTATSSLHDELKAELDADMEDVLRSPAARAAWEDVQDEVDAMPLSLSRSSTHLSASVSSCHLSPSSAGSSLSSRSRRSRPPSSIGERAPVYPDPIGTASKALSAQGSSVGCSSPGPLTPCAPAAFYSYANTCEDPQHREKHQEKHQEKEQHEWQDHPCMRFWQHCTPAHLETLEQFVAVWISNGLQMVESDWRRLDVAEREKEGTRRVYEGLLEQYAALRAYRVYRSGCTAEQLLDELSV
ncbi:hypothetical protein CALCODRAFT_194729 [Calocera cornea HHB12733]|uniref:Uncharacterized protein n=1 Tax=Calocera cornea HHB12733 TaxID=1353952 RepID=A0A165HIH9_9BASI|nr:hypothetical protein CALCODRAFT_194729 [Calocera cornea HHB12733]